MISNSVILGSMSAVGSGEAFWKDMALRSSTPLLLDAALLVINSPDNTDVAIFEDVWLPPLISIIKRKHSIFNVSYHADSGRLPEKPWRIKYNDDHARVENGFLTLDNSGSGKNEYCYISCGVPSIPPDYRFAEIDLSLKLPKRLKQPQFSLVVALPSVNGENTVWSFKFSNNGITVHNSSKQTFTPFQFNCELKRLHFIFDHKSGRGEVYSKNQKKQPLLRTYGRKAKRYQKGIKFGDLSKSVKGSVAIKSVTFSLKE
jgi:hypothetical protein